MRLQGRKGAHVHMNARVKFQGDALEAIREDRPMRFVKGVADVTEAVQQTEAGLGARDERPNYPVGGAAAIEPEKGASALEVISWNRGMWVDDSNMSHAERQFIEFIDARVKTGRVESIEIEINKSPCSICAGDLAAFAARLKNPHRPKDVKLSLKWTELYEHPKIGTTQAAIAQLYDAGWNVAGGKKASDATKALKVELLERIKPIRRKKKAAP